MAATQSHIKKLTDQTASLVSLLQLTLTGQNNMHAMQAELQAQRADLRAHGAAPEVLAHVATVEAAAGVIAAAESPADVHAALQHVEDSQMALAERSVEQLAGVHRSMQHALADVRPGPPQCSFDAGALPCTGLTCWIVSPAAVAVLCVVR